MTSIRTPKNRKNVLRTLVGALILTLAPTAATTAAASPQDVMTDAVIRYDDTTTVALPGVPAGATAVRLTVSGRWAWKPTQLSVCPGSTATDSCTASADLHLPVQNEASATVTVPLSSAANGQVTVHNSDASARVSLDVVSYTVGSTAVAAPAPGPARATDAGVPAGTKLTVHHGDLHITQPGTVIDSLDIRGIVRVKAPDVTIKRSIIRGKPLTGSMALITNDLGKNRFTVEDSELVSAHPSPYISGIIGHNFTVRRTEIANVIDSLHITGSNVRVEDSWLHDHLFYASDPNHGGGPSHADAIQIQGGTNMQFLNNEIEGAHSSAVQTTQDSGLISNVTFQGNRISGGGCSINVFYGGKTPITGLTVRDNVFGLDTRHARCAIVAPLGNSVSNVNNVFTDGTKVSISRG